ncbi:MAG TPA: TetR/AcrR family transcriptional regulator [Symbiobacteriaceae bacterium]|jgi:TetR/AcrR family transcriptional regulator
MERDAEQTRRRILDAARGEFAVKGLAGSRVDQIAARSDTNKRMIYAYFGDKDGLYAEVVRTVLVEVAAALPPIDRGDPVRAVREATGAYFDSCVRRPDFIRIMLWEAVSGWETANRVFPVSLDAWPLDLTQVIQSGIEQGIFRQDLNPGLAMVASLSQLFFFMPLMWKLHDGALSAAELAAAREGLIDLILHSLGGMTT